MEQNTTAAAAIYVRGDSPQSADTRRQLELCREYCRLNLRIQGEDAAVYEDGFAPGERPGMSAMLADARAGKFSAVVCAELDKICYSTVELASLLDELGSHSVTFVAVSERLSTATPLGRAMVFLSASLSRLDRQGSARRVRDGMLELAKTGRWLGGVSPTGYASNKSKSQDGVEYALVRIPEEAAVVRQIFTIFLETNSLVAVERRLNDIGIRTKNNREYSRFSIRQILENPVYAWADQDAYQYFSEAGAEIFSPRERFDGTCGLMVYNKTAQQSRQSAKSRDVSEWIVAVGLHEGLVTGAEWVQAQKLLRQNKSSDFRKPRSAHALLPGILRCGQCGAFMRPKQTRRMTEDGQPVFVYLCERKERTKSLECAIRNVGGNILDKAICDQLKGLSSDENAILELLESNRRISDPELDRMEANRLETRRGHIEKNISDLVFSLIKVIDKTAFDYVMRQIDELHQQKAEIDRRAAELADLTEPHLLAGEQAEMIKELFQTFQSGFDEMAVEEKRALLRAVVQKVVWDGTHARLYLFGADAARLNPSK